MSPDDLIPPSAMIGIPAESATLNTSSIDVTLGTPNPVLTLSGTESYLPQYQL